MSFSLNRENLIPQIKSVLQYTGQVSECLTEEQEISRDGQNMAQNYTTTRVMVTLQFRSVGRFTEEVEIVVASLKKGGLPELIIHQQNLFKMAGRP